MNEHIISVSMNKMLFELPPLSSTMHLGPTDTRHQMIAAERWRAWRRWIAKQQSNTGKSGWESVCDDTYGP